MQDLKEEDFKDLLSNWIKFGKIGDWIKGVYLGCEVKESQFDANKKVNIYEIKIIAGSYHDIKKEKVDEQPTLLNQESGTYYLSGKRIIDLQMKQVKIGQRILVTYTGDFTVPGRPKPAKTIKIQAGGMDPEFIAGAANQTVAAMRAATATNQPKTEQEIKLSDIPF